MTRWSCERSLNDVRRSRGDGFWMGPFPFSRVAQCSTSFVQRDLDRIPSRYELPKTSDVLRATEMLMKLERDAASKWEAEDLLEIFAEVLPTDLWEEVMRRFES